MFDANDWLPKRWDLTTYDALGRYADFLDECGRAHLAAHIRKEWIEYDMRVRTHCVGNLLCGWVEYWLTNGKRLNPSPFSFEAKLHAALDADKAHLEESIYV